MIWQKPHISKTYEALTAIADGRIEVDGKKAKCFSSSKGKFYEIEYDESTNSIMSNDNSAYYTGTLSYPMIVFLMIKGKVSYNESLLKPLKGIFWKGINQKFKNDYTKAVELVIEDLQKKGEDIEFIQTEVQKIHEEVCKLEMNYLGERKAPPRGF